MRKAKNACPACGFIVFVEGPGGYELCDVCNWENDGVQYADPNYRGGANEESLVEAQRKALSVYPYGCRRHADRQRDPWWRPLMPPEVEAGPSAMPRCENDDPPPYWFTSPLGWESVLTVDDWYDGPIKGIANVGGRPHAYVATQDAATGESSHEMFELRAVEPQIVGLAAEAWEIRLRWYEARRRGATANASPPALPDDRVRYQELRSALDRVFDQGEPAAKARAEWVWFDEVPTHMGYIAVRWEATT